MSEYSSPGTPRLQSLLALTISALMVFASVIFIVLYVLGWWHARDFANIPDGDRNTYINARLAAALETFQVGILPLPEGSARPISATAVQLLQGLPECRKAWDDAPGPIKRLKAAVKGKTLDSATTADRLAGKIVALDAYLARQSAGGNRRIQQAVALDASRWFEAARVALNTPVHMPHPEGSKVKHVELKLACADLAAAVRTLIPESCRRALLLPGGGDADREVGKNCRLLENLDWRESAVASVVSKFQPYQQVGVPAKLIAQRNPWGGVPGCVYWHAGGAKANGLLYKSNSARGNRLICENENVSGLAEKDAAALAAVAGTPNDAMPLSDLRWSIPPSLDLILRPLDALRLPGSQLYHDYTNRDARTARNPEHYGYGRNTATIGGAKLDVGFSVDLAIDGTAQAYAQQIAACYTGAQEVCHKLGVRRLEDQSKGKKSGDQPIGHRLQEDAVVRMAGIAIIDIATGRIEAVAGALSPCARQDNDGPGRGPECDNRLPWQPAYRRDLLENPALFHDAMPASTVKPIMAAAFLTDGAYGERLLVQELAANRPTKPPTGGLRFELMKSDSAGFLDRMFCKEKGFKDCQRPWHMQRMAHAFGWNTACTDRIDCGQRDVLFGRTPDNVGENGLVVPSARMTMFGRLLTEPLSKGQQGEDQRFHLMPHRDLNPDNIKHCMLGKDGVDSPPLQKKGDDWRDCRAGYSGQVVHEGWGQSDARASAVGVASMMAMLGAAANGATSVPAPHLVEQLRGVGKTVTGNTQLLTAEQRFELAPPLPVKVPAQAAQVILSGLNWSHRGGTASSACNELWGEDHCRDVDWIAGKTGTPSFHNDNKPLDVIAKECQNGNCSSLRPYKWYTGVFRLGEGPQWNKAIAVLTERNWLKGNGTVHGAGDQGPNPAAEIALQVARCLHENPTGKDKAACRQ